MGGVSGCVGGVSVWVCVRSGWEGACVCVGGCVGGVSGRVCGRSE